MEVYGVGFLTTGFSERTNRKEMLKLIHTGLRMP
jgi:hypothetical protein